MRAASRLFLNQETKMICQKKNRILWTISWNFAACLLACLFGAPLYAQDEEALPEPRTVSLETSDGVALSALYYPGTQEKETIPVILLHAWDEDHKSMVAIASTLQEKYGFAAILPDLRGHGLSQRTTKGDELDRDRWRTNELGSVIEDIEACKKFLIKENNQGELNIDLLCVVADNESTIFATLWTLRDWSYGPLGGMKQGQDVKSLVLLNPSRNFKGLNAAKAYQNDLLAGRNSAFPILVAYSGSGRDAKNIYDRVARGRKNLAAKKKALEKHRFEVEKGKRVSKKRGKTSSMGDLIGDFLKSEVASRQQDYRWAKRGGK